jgi:hypothetical protein
VSLIVETPSQFAVAAILDWNKSVETLLATSQT